jgi:hypothetical protein
LAALESGDVAKARRVDQEIATAFGDVAALKDREAILQRKVDVERQELDAEKYRSAVAAVERALPARLKAAREFEDALHAVTLAAKRFQKSTRAVFADWPAGNFRNADKSEGNRITCPLSAGRYVDRPMLFFGRYPVAVISHCTADGNRACCR